MRILFVGDIVGRPGREVLAHWLPLLRDDLRLDVVIANAENAAGGLGVTPSILKELKKLGIAGFTLGNHTWRKKELVGMLDLEETVARPVNYPPGVPGRGSVVLTLEDGRRLGLINVLGRVYMDAFECPFRSAMAEAERLRQEGVKVVVVDMHAEATSEKAALGWYLDGRCTAVLGTHTHVQTADERLLDQGTAYISDVGMTGPRDGVIGLERERAIGKFLTGLPNEFKVAPGPSQLSGVVVEADDADGRAVAIERIVRVCGEPVEPA